MMLSFNNRLTKFGLGAVFVASILIFARYKGRQFKKSHIFWNQILENFYTRIFKLMKDPSILEDTYQETIKYVHLCDEKRAEV